MIKNDNTNWNLLFDYANFATGSTYRLINAASAGNLSLSVPYINLSGASVTTIEPSKSIRILYD
jgi:hypothetical protein